MIPLPHYGTVRLFKQAQDMRLGMFRLQGLISAAGAPVNERSGLYLFTNRTRTLVKGLWCDGSGLCLFSKRLEEGTFSWPLSAAPDDDCPWFEVQARVLTLLLDGIELKKSFKKAWYEA